MNLEAKIERSYNMLDALPKDKEYLLAFSGGKDSHVLLAPKMV
jgi:tRNA(Ile)-lysidine synthase TilS/MesJ